MKKLLFALMLLPLGATAQLTFDPYVAAGYLKEVPNVKNSRIAYDYEGLPSYEGAPRLVYMSDISNPRGSGMYFGGGFNLGIKNFPLSLQIEIVGQHYQLQYDLFTINRGRTEYNFDTMHYSVNGYQRIFRLTPSLVYKVKTKAGMTYQANAGISLIGPDNNHYPFMEVETNQYAAVNAGLGIGYKALMLTAQVDFGTANMLKDRYRPGFNMYSRRISAGISIYPKQLAEWLQ